MGKFHLGGQAIIEGVLIRSPKWLAMAARTPKGKIVTKRDKFISATEKHKMLALPFLRGIIHLWEMLVVGMRALTWSANQQGEEEELGGFELFITFAFAFLLTIGLFVVLPYYLALFFSPPEEFLFGVVDGVARLAVFLGYLIAIGAMKDVRRMFQYHGAEHMAVHCVEAKKKLTVNNVKRYPPEHPRCGTSFLVYVVAVSIVVFSLIRSPHWFVNVPLRIVLIPVVAGVSYELLKFSAKHKWMRVLTFPGIWAQKLTTKKPDARQIEVAIAAVNKAR